MNCTGWRWSEEFTGQISVCEIKGKDNATFFSYFILFLMQLKREREREPPRAGLHHFLRERNLWWKMSFILSDI